jgi:hypothetical protein
MPKDRGGNDILMTMRHSLGGIARDISTYTNKEMGMQCSLGGISRDISTYTNKEMGFQRSLRVVISAC